MFWQILGIIFIGCGAVIPFFWGKNFKLTERSFKIIGIFIIALGTFIMTLDSNISEKEYKSKISSLVNFNNKKAIEDSLSKVFKLQVMKENILTEININLKNINSYQAIQNKIDRRKNIIHIQLNYDFATNFLHEVNDTLVREKIQELISHSRFTNNYLDDIYSQKADLARTKNVLTLDTLIQENKVLCTEILELISN